MKAPINKIIPFSNVDGPGNRTAIFFQSCPFKCLYCHNPETINECINCGKCIETCPANALHMENDKVVWNEKKCVQCDSCIKTCPHLSTPKITYMSVEDIVEYLKQHIAFIEGITVSGGECMEHADFLLDLFREVKKLGLTCLIDSNGAYDFEEYQELLHISDGVMLDIKAVDEEFHYEICHYKNSVVLKNLRFLKELGKLEEVRTVLLPKYEEQNMQTVLYVSRILQNTTRYKLLRYRHYGVREEGITYFGQTILSMDEVSLYVDAIHKEGQTNVVVV